MTEHEMFNRALNLGIGWEVHDVSFMSPAFTANAEVVKFAKERQVIF